MDVLDVHIFAAVRIRTHQTGLIGDASLDVVDGGSLSGLLQRRGCHMRVCCLLHAVNR